MSPQKLIACLLVCLFSVIIAHAQDQAYLRMDAPATALQTGQETVVTITGQNLPSLWVGNMVIHYDPTAIYIMGTMSGSPVTPGQAITDQPSLVARNAISSGSLTYTFSLVNPATPLSGTLALGTFRIYPLKAGPTEIQFFSGQLSSFTPPADGQPIGGDDIVDVSFLPVLLKLDITGETVAPPIEATATPAPAETELPAQLAIDIPPTEVGLVNVTAAPLEPSTPDTTAAPAGETSPIVFAALGMIVLALLGLGGLFISRRKR